MGLGSYTPKQLCEIRGWWVLGQFHSRGRTLLARCSDGRRSGLSELIAQ
jgi:hypothetical protein